MEYKKVFFVFLFFLTMFNLNLVFSGTIPNVNTNVDTTSTKINDSFEYLRFSVNGLNLQSGESYQIIKGIKNLKFEFKFKVKNNSQGGFDLKLKGFKKAIRKKTEISSYINTTHSSLDFNIDLSSATYNKDKLFLVINGLKDFKDVFNTNFTFIYKKSGNELIVDEVEQVPNKGVEIGSELGIILKLENKGSKDQNSVKVVGKIKTLGIEDEVIIPRIKSEKTKTSERLRFQIPNEAKVGFHTLAVKIFYGDNILEENIEIEVIESIEKKFERLLITPPKIVKISRDSTRTTFTMTIENKQNKEIPITFSSNDVWYNLVATPSILILKANEKETVTIELSKIKSKSNEGVLNIYVKEGTRLSEKLEVDYILFNDAKIPEEKEDNLVYYLIGGGILLLGLLVMTKLKGGNGGENEIPREYNHLHVNENFRKIEKENNYEDNTISEQTSPQRSNNVTKTFNQVKENNTEETPKKPSSQPPQSGGGDGFY